MAWKNNMEVLLNIILVKRHKKCYKNKMDIHIDY